jgi:hypothetical protein
VFVHETRGNGLRRARRPGPAWDDRQRFAEVSGSMGRPGETAETHVVLLITQRRQAQQGSRIMIMENTRSDCHLLR